MTSRQKQKLTLSDVRSSLSFIPLLKKLESICSGQKNYEKVKSLVQRIRQVPELAGSKVEISSLTKQQDLLSELMYYVFPPVLDKSEIRAAYVPFSDTIFHSSQLFTDLFIDEKSFRSLSDTKGPKEDLRIFYAYFNIAKFFYGLDIVPNFSKIISKKDANGLTRYYDIKFDASYVEIIPPKTITPLKEEEIRYLKQNSADLNVWQSLIPLEDFEFIGFVLIYVNDVTNEQTVSLIREALLSPEAILSYNGFLELQGHIRNLMKLNEIVLAVAAIENEEVYILNKGTEISERRKFMQTFSFKMENFIGSIFHKVFASKEPLLIEDLRDYPNKTPVEKDMASKKVINVYLVPLVDNDKVIGILELFSPVAGELYSMNVMKLKSLIPLFTVVVKKVIEDMSREVQIVIQEKYTAIHPSVAWKFKKSAHTYLRQVATEQQSPNLEDIVFPDVFPLYAMSDIRGSSERRNKAIQEDLVYQLNLIRDILKRSYEITPLSFTDNLFYKLEKNLTRIENEIHTGDEGNTIDFFIHEIDPALDKLIHITPEIKEAVHFYKNVLDPVHRVVYHKRKMYDEDIAKINRTLSEYIDMEEEKVQKLYPHYFEKNATDGVDFSIYIGESIIENSFFDSLYIKDLRIWQLKVLCGLSKVADKLKKELNDPMEIAHLTLVQNMPLTIQYMLDDKQFVVNGSYNIRYEILKKRIDKAKTKDGGERITQPNKIAIIYSQPREGEEYRGYIEYLIARKYLHPEIEELELEDLQGVSGLSAFRVKPIL